VAVGADVCDGVSVSDTPEKGVSATAAADARVRRVAVVGEATNPSAAI
jgi:hypothetical protein